MECLSGYLSWFHEWNEAHGNHVVILRVLVSKNAPYHALIRRVYEYRNGDGILRIQQDKALKEAGVLPPAPDEEETRYNNAKITFDRESLEAFRLACEEAGLMVNRKPGIHSLDQALKEKERVEDIESRYDADLKVLEAAESAWEDESLLAPSYTESGSVQLTAAQYRILKIRSAMLPYYEHEAKTVAAMEVSEIKKRKEEDVQYGILSAELDKKKQQYLTLRLGLFRCGYSLKGGVGE